MWKYTSYVRTGLSHESIGTECQDSVLVDENDACIVAALADGLGSLEYSEIAANITTKTVTAYFLSGKHKRLDLFTPGGIAELTQELIGVIQSRIQEKATELDLSTDAMDCTLGFVCVCKQEEYAIIGRIGDSAVCIIRQKGSVVINDSSVSANSTSAVLDADASQGLQIQVCDLKPQEVEGFILCSDGLDNEVYMKGLRHVPKTAEPYFNSVWAEDPQRIIRERVETLLSYEDTPFDDDISIAVVSRAGNVLIFAEDPTWLCSCGARNRLQDVYCYNCDNDIITVYENYRFKEYGGKDAFFLWMNQHPEEEAKIWSPEEKPDPEPDRKELWILEQNLRLKYRKQMAAVATVALTAGLILGILVGRIANCSQADRNEETVTTDTTAVFTEPSTAATETDTATMETAMEPMEETETRKETTVEPPLELTDGSLYWGSVENGVPNGWGVLLKDGYYYLGQYAAGKMDGVFTIVSQNGNSRISFAEFREDELSWSDDEELIRWVVSCPVLEIYSEPNGRIIAEVEKNAVIYRTATPESETEEGIWLEVIYNNSVGWINGSRYSPEE